MYLFTITTKDKCRHCINDFDNELQVYLKSRDVPLDTYYKLEESKYTKWHAHGLVGDKWELTKDSIFFVHFKRLEDDRPETIAQAMGYINKADFGMNHQESLNLLNKGTPYFIPEE